MGRWNRFLSTLLRWLRCLRSLRIVFADLTWLRIAIFALLFARRSRSPLFVIRSFPSHVEAIELIKPTQVSLFHWLDISDSMLRNNSSINTQTSDVFSTAVLSYSQCMSLSSLFQACSRSARCNCVLPISASAGNIRNTKSSRLGAFSQIGVFPSIHNNYLVVSFVDSFTLHRRWSQDELILSLLDTPEGCGLAAWDNKIKTPQHIETALTNRRRDLVCVWEQNFYWKKKRVRTIRPICKRAYPTKKDNVAIDHVDRSIK